MLWFLSRADTWKLDKELTENQDDSDPEDLRDAMEPRLGLDLTDLPDTRLELEATETEIQSYCLDQE